MALRAVQRRPLGSDRRRATGGGQAPLGTPFPCVTQRMTSRADTSVVWNDHVLMELDETSPYEIWAISLDGSDTFGFLPTMSSNVHYGPDCVTGRSADDRLVRRRIGGDLEVLDTNVVKTTMSPEFGRIAYLKREGDALVLRQHFLAE